MNTRPAIALLGVLTLMVLPACSTSRSSPGGHESAQRERTITGRWAIVIHGGAGMLDRSMPESERQAYHDSLDRALSAGETILKSGGTSLDAVEASVRVLEDDPRFNAGRGAVLTRDGTCELDASIMNGRTLACGAVAGAKTVKNPISFARRIMQETPHILFTGDGAERLAASMGVERADPAYFITPRRQEQLEKKMRELAQPKTSAATHAPSDVTQGTVGCVALDIRGDLAAATSTGGMTAKMPGRVGDSPIIGAGCYANNVSLGVSCTGTGEQFIRNAAAHELSSLVRYQSLSLADAASIVLNQRLDPDDGGLIAIDREGRIVMVTTTGCMPAASSDWRGRRTFRMWDQ